MRMSAWQWRTAVRPARSRARGLAAAAAALCMLRLPRCPATVARYADAGQLWSAMRAHHFMRGWYKKTCPLVRVMTGVPSWVRSTLRGCMPTAMRCETLDSRVICAQCLCQAPTHVWIPAQLVSQKFVNHVTSEGLWAHHLMGHVP
jgi:hypothetical protein